MSSHSPFIGTILLMSNYFHDVATAMPLASGLLLRAIIKRYEDNPTDGFKAFLMRAYDGISKLFAFSVAWLIAGGIPRIITLRDFEWANAVIKGHTEALAVKYAIAGTMTIAGLVYWHGLMRKMKAVKKS